MKFLIKTQVVAILFALLWEIHLTILAFLDMPGRAIQYINWFVFAFAILIGILYVVISKFSLEKKWFSIPLVLIPDFILYQPLFLRILSSIVNEGFAGVIHFFSLSTGSINFIATILGLLLGITFSRHHK